MLCAWDRVEAHAAARKLAAIAELARRNPKPEDEEFTADQLGCSLGESRTRAYALLGTADHLDTHLSGTRAALCDGTLSMVKAQIIVNATGLLDPDEARAAEAEVLDRASRLTPGGLRAAIARAVMEVAPKKAKERRENAARFARVERWAEDTGNAALMGRELPPDEVLAADQRIAALMGRKLPPDEVLACDQPIRSTTATRSPSSWSPTRSTTDPPPRAPSAPPPALPAHRPCLPARPPAPASAPRSGRPERLKSIPSASISSPVR